MPRTLVAASLFSSGRAYSFLNFLPSLFLCLIPTLLMQRLTSLLTTPPRCHFLMCTLPPIRSSPTDGRSNSFPSLFWRTSIVITLSGTQKVLPSLAGRKYSTGSSLLTSSPSMTLIHPPFSIVSP